MTTPNDALDFYPTPDNLAWEMVHSLETEIHGFRRFPSPVLEPSAGDGALARQIHTTSGIYHDPKTGKVRREYLDRLEKVDLDCIELSSDFRAVLKKDGFRVVHDNFLTFRPTTKYAAIVMNPPFSAGAAHLLKALDVMQDGGKVRCLLNAETLRNPCTNERKELAAKLEELHATVKYIPDAFKNARRAARVEVALVSVDIPDREPVSRIRLDLKNETAERLKENPEFAALVSSDPITAAIERYNAAAEGVRRIYAEYDGIKSLFSSAGAGKKENPVMAFTKSYNDAIRELRGMYWKQLFEMPQLFDAMTYEMQQDYQKRIKELEGYDFSAYNILTVREEISRNLLSSIDHEIIKLFDDWTNLHYNDEYSKNVHYYNGWCTNSAYKINRKVIFRCNAFDTYDGRFCPRYNATGHVAQIERVLHFLDTNGKPYNGDELRAVLDAAEKGTPGELKMPPEMVKAVCDQAHAMGYPVAAHTESPEGVKVALENGVDSIEHGAKMDEETIRLYKERGAFVCTTISPALPYALFDTAVSGASEKDQYNGKIVFDGVVESAKTALANGIPVGLRNDVGCPYITQYDFWRELCYFHKYCGVSNQFALYTATLRNARLAGVGDVTGSLEVGKSEDLIVTRQNPLEDLRALQHLELVVCRGHVIKKPNPKRNKTVDALLDPYLE